MQFIKDRFSYLFNSTKGLILVAIAMVAIVTAVWGMLSGPMAEMGVREIVIKALGEMLRPVRGIAGATETGDRRVVLVLDVGALIQEVTHAI